MKRIKVAVFGIEPFITLYSNGKGGHGLEYTLLKTIEEKLGISLDLQTGTNRFVVWLSYVFKFQRL